MEIWRLWLIFLTWKTIAERNDQTWSTVWSYESPRRSWERHAWSSTRILGGFRLEANQLGSTSHRSWWLTYPSEKYESVGIIPNWIGKNVPNHQPVSNHSHDWTLLFGMTTIDYQITCMKLLGCPMRKHRKLPLFHALLSALILWHLGVSGKMPCWCLTWLAG